MPERTGKPTTNSDPSESSTTTRTATLICPPSRSSLSPGTPRRRKPGAARSCTTDSHQQWSPSAATKSLAPSPSPYHASRQYDRGSCWANLSAFHRHPRLSRRRCLFNRQYTFCFGFTGAYYEWCPIRHLHCERIGTARPILCSSNCGQNEALSHCVTDTSFGATARSKYIAIARYRNRIRSASYRIFPPHPGHLGFSPNAAMATKASVITQASVMKRQGSREIRRGGRGCVPSPPLRATQASPPHINPTPAPTDCPLPLK